MRNELIFQILNTLFSICHAEGGDGDSTWYTSVFSIKEIMVLIEKYNEVTEFPWTIDADGVTITLSQWPEECIVITSDINVFNQRPTYGRIQT